MNKGFDDWQPVVALALPLPLPLPDTGMTAHHGTAKAARIANVVRSAWRDRAKKPQRAVFGQRP